MKFVVICALAIYWLGYLYVFIGQMASGPVTLGLATLRAAVWPYYLATGKPEGTRSLPD